MSCKAPDPGLLTIIISTCPNPANQEIECIDEMIALTLNKATLKVGGQKKGVSCSKKKAQTLGAIKH